VRRDPAEVEAKLLRAAARGDEGARRRVVASHLPLVRSVATRYASLGLPFDDLVQEGCVGLLEAIDRWDRARGVPFEAFARFRVRVAIRDALTARARLIRLPKHVLESQRRGEAVEPPRAVASPDVEAAALTEGAEEELVAREQDAAVDRAVDGLSPRQRIVIKHRYGFDGPEESLGQVAAELRLSRGRTLAIERQALARLRRSLAGLR